MDPPLTESLQCHNMTGILRRYAAEISWFLFIDLRGFRLIWCCFLGFSRLIRCLDRVGFLARVTGSLVRKPMAGIVAVRRGGAVPTMDAITHMGQINQMIIVGSTYWNFAFGLDKGDALDDEEGMKNMENLGENLAWLLEKLNK